MKYRITLIVILIFTSVYSQSWTTTKLKDLEVTSQPQIQNQLCWAAVTATVINYFNDTNYQDCDMAKVAFNSNCCNNPKPCNKQNSIHFISNAIGNIAEVDTKVILGQVSKQRLMSLVDDYNPLVLRVASKFGGHFIVVTGYITYKHKVTGEEKLTIMIQDPMWGYFTRNNDGTRTMAKFIEYNDLITGKGPDYELNWTDTIEIVE